MQKLRIFAASPSDVATERAKVETAAAMLKPLADALGIVLDVVDWRAAVPDMGRPQQVIFDQLKPTEWDVFVGILWHRFGTPPGGQDEQARREYLSGTEEEFKTAYRLWKEHGRPHLMMYRCTRPIPPDALDPEQFKRVKEFFAQFEAAGEHPGLHQTFDTTEAFERLLLDNLQRLLLTYGEKLKGAPIEPQVVQALAPKIPNNLPRRAAFFGRHKDMEVVMRALSPEDRTWGVLIDGIGGIGKTSLAVEAAHRCKETGRFEAFVFVSAKQHALAPGGIREQTPAARTLDEFLNETARVLDQPGIPKLASDPKRRALLDALRERPTLLIYDNLETLTKEEQEALADFLRELPQGSKAVITSRRRGGEGSVWLRLGKLDWDAARQLIAAEAERDAALAAKLQRAGESGWQQLYDATGGSPLALSHTLGLMRVRAALSFDSALSMLRGNRDADLQNFIFQEARRELTTNDEAALRALSFFAPSATFEAWAEVAQLSRTELETTIDRLSALSLVDVLAGEERYALHPLTRSFVRDVLLADGQLARKAGANFVRYWIGYAEQYGGSDANYKTYSLVEVEWANLDATAELLWQMAGVEDESLADKEAAQLLNRLAVAVAKPLFYMGQWDNIIRVRARAYEAASVLGDWRVTGWQAHHIAWLHYYRGETADAAQWADHSTDAWAHSGGKYEQAKAMRMQGLVSYMRKDYDAAERLFLGALAIWRDLKNDHDAATALNNLGMLAERRKLYDDAERYYREAFMLAEKGGFGEPQAYVSNNLGNLGLARKLWEQAREWFEKGLLVSREIGRQDSIAAALYGLARAHESAGRPELSLPLAEEALAITEKLWARNLPETRELVERLKKKIVELK
ncbi:MAG TPA: tetratricopeptide repeat protein [Pyrinomonadaceae bacterium]|nr:tetratricopeptide repeat protein [Pyrinomonadaceae bacterium]